jgi:SAM-dependent methyltransferase
MQCRICGANEARTIGEVEYYSGFVRTIFECDACLCRFTKHDPEIYNWLHSTPSSIYGLYRHLGESTRRLFEGRDLAGLREELSKTAKYKFVIDSVAPYPSKSRLLEIGCARGFLASYFILAGYDIMGTDVSPEAIAGARAAFGDCFALSDSTAIQDRAPYDAIYHTGTIGCVDDPVGLTSHLLKLLKPGGRLYFNAPNADSCWLKGQLWIDAAPPPDVVTLFRPGFWQKLFSGIAEVLEAVEICSPDRAFGIELMKLLGRRWQKPTPFALDASANYYDGRPEENGNNGNIWHLVERTGGRIGRMTGLARLTPSQPNPFGLFVTLTKK